MSTITETTQQAGERAEALAERIVGGAVQAMDIASIHIGSQLGLYAALAGAPATPGELAARAGADARYVREWLEQQAVTSILDVDDPVAAPDRRRYSLPAGHDEALLDADSLAYLAPLARLTVSLFHPLPALLDAYRQGGGVPYPDYGEDARAGIAAMNRPMFVNQLGSEWLPAVPDVHARLLADPPARVADLGCGEGWSTISIARAYPRVAVDGFDLDAASVAAARDNVAAEGLADRVAVHERDAGDADLAGGYDLVTIFEAVHDMARPVEALRNARRLLGGDGTVVVADERVAEAFAPPGDETERLMYGFSVLHCLPVGRAEGPSAETGAAMRPDTLRAYASEAGFATVEVLPIENDFWRFYRLAG